MTDEQSMSRKDIATELMGFVGWDRKPEFWAWYSAYDHVCLAQIFGTMIQLPGLLPMYTNDIRTLVDLAGLKPNELPKQPSGHHNALADAQQNVVRYNYLMEKLQNA